MIVVFDTNIWISQLFLQAPPGIAARFYITQKKARVALPEVVRLEVERHLLNRLRNLTSELDSKHKQLLAIFGSLKELVLPTDAELEETPSRTFKGLAVELLEIPFTLESARDSFLRTIDKRPLSQGSQQFKDGVLWADCLSLLKEDDVALVSDDKAFYEGQDRNKGLANELLKELSGFKHTLTLHSNLPDFLRENETEVEIDPEALAEAYWEVVGSEAEELLAKHGFQLAERISLDHDVFLTESADTLFLKFQIDHRCTDVSGMDRGDAVLKLTGDGFYNPQEQKFSQLAPLRTGLSFRDAEGVEHNPANVFLRVGPITFGHANVTHTVRHRLEDF